MAAASALPRPWRDVAPQINVTPLVDVMLVLLVIFLLSVPVATQRLPLSNAACMPACGHPGEPVRLAVKATGELYWNGAPVTRAALAANLAALERRPAATLQIYPERGVRYERITEVLAAARNAGVVQIGIAPVDE